MATYPTIALQPGQSGAEVKKLQEYLISQGFSIPAGATGYYGEQTKAAVSQLQQKLGVDVAGNPGYWGPKTLSVLSQAPQTTQLTATPSIQQAQQQLDLLRNQATQFAQQQGLSEQQIQSALQKPTTAPTMPQEQLSPLARQFGPEQISQAYQALDAAGADRNDEMVSRYITDAGFRSRVDANAKTPIQSQTPIQPQAQAQQAPQEDSAVLAQLTKVLESLSGRGMALNPNVVIDDAKILEFLRLAEEEVTPGFQAQLRVAREGLYRDLGYASDEVLRNEQQIEKKYGLRVRKIGEEQAERGFAQSGRRLEEEQLLREETAQEIGAGRRKLEFGAGTAARTFAQKYGAGFLPQRTLEERPQVVSGIPSFTRTGTQRPLYELSDDVYRNLVGSQEKERLLGIRSLAQQREELTRTGLTSPIYSQYQPRALTL